MKNGKQAEHFDVKLHVREGKGEGGWKHVNVGGVDYEWRYTGGNKGDGNHEAYVGEGENVLDVGLHHDVDRYAIDGCTFEPDMPDQFWFVRADALHGEVHDANTVKAQTDYTVIVLDTKLGNRIPCHPMMKNIPPP